MNWQAIRAISLTLSLIFTAVSLGQSVSLPRSTPEEQGVSSVAIADFIKTADAEVDSMHSFMLLRHGHVIAEAWWAPEAADKPHVLWSLTKSFTSTAVGLAIADGKLSLDDLVVDLLPEHLPDHPSRKLRSMRVRDLLTMSTGHQDEVNLRDTTDWIGAFLRHEVPHKPGTHFRYNTPASHMLSVIINKVTGKTTQEILTPAIFDPLGIEVSRWDTSPSGLPIGGYGLYLKTEDIAKFGQLLLQGGQWENKQLIPKSWVDMATSKQVSNGSNPESDWDQGYGFQFWRCRHNAFRGDGKAGQFCLVLPEHDAVIVMTANSRNLQEQLNIVWDKLLPAFEEVALEPSTENLGVLRGVCNSLQAKR